MFFDPTPPPKMPYQLVLFSHDKERMKVHKIPVEDRKNDELVFLMKGALSDASLHMWKYILASYYRKTVQSIVLVFYDPNDSTYIIYYY